MSQLTLLLLLSLGSWASASHYYGGTIAVASRGQNSDGSFTVDIRYKETFRGGCYNHNRWSCSGNCGYVTGFESGRVDSSSAGFNWCQSEGYITRRLLSNEPFTLHTASCCWISNVNSGSLSWRLWTYLDLGTRSDTNAANTPPVTTIIPQIRFPSNCNRNINLMAFDPDGDRVRCRYGLVRYTECYACQQHSGFYLDQDNCNLRYNGYSYSRTGARVFELILEDFSRQQIWLTYSNGTSRLSRPARAYNQYATSYYPSASTSSPTTESTLRTTAYAPPASTSNPTTSASILTTTAYAPPASTSNPTTSASILTTTAYAPPASTSNPTTSASILTTTAYAPPASTSSPSTSASIQRIPAYARPASTSSPTTSPLSRIPLQFIVRIDNAVPSCTEGLYLPAFLYPTPYNGEIFNISVGQKWEITVKAQATRSQLSDFLISGPLNITERKVFHGSVAELTISWTPTQTDIAYHFAVCFIAESTIGNTIVYHSEMRCVILHVGPKNGEANVICNETTMTVEVAKSSIVGLHEDHLRLNDPSCTLDSNGTHVRGTISLNSCGTQLEETDDNLVFKNEITSFDDPYAVITRRHEVQIMFSCSYPKTGRVSLEFKAHKIPYVFTEEGFGQFTYRFEFFHSDLFYLMVDPSTYPVEVPLKEMLYMEIRATSSIRNTVLFVETCRATPIDDPNYHIFYSIIENGCIVDDTLVEYPQNATEYKFGMEAFKFIGNYDEVFISCSVILCKAWDYSTRCAQGCTNASTTTSGYNRRRRSVPLQTASHSITQGPLRLKRNIDQPEVRDSQLRGYNLNMNLVFLAGILLAALAMVCGVMIFKTKMSKVKYQLLPSSDF